MIIVFMIGFIHSISKKKSDKKKQTHLSIIIPFHNELENLPKLIASLNKLEYPKNKFEVILVNDCSTDGCEDWLEKHDSDFVFKHFIINLTKKTGKKTAIEKGLILASNDRIVTTDADCTFHPNWLNEINNAKGKLAIGITLKQSNSFGLLHKIQECESMMLGGITIGSASIKIPLLASGANLSYRKKDFDKIKPYEDNKHIASGDDMFLLESMIKNKKKISVRSNHPVLTQTKESWTSYIQQTTRWSAKTSNLDIKGLGLVALITILGNVFWLATLVFWIITEENIFLTLAVIKFTVDFLFLFLTSLTFKRLILMIYTPIIALFYPFYLLVLSSKVLTYKENWSSNG